MAENESGVQIISPSLPTGVIYVRDGRKILVHTESCVNNGHYYDVAFVNGSLQWDDGTPVSWPERKRISEELVEGAKAMNWEIQIDAGSETYS